METVQTEDTRFVRDLHSKALLSTDRIALENHRLYRKRAMVQSNEFEELKTKVDELNTVREEMLEIKSLLRELLNKKEL